MADLNTDPSDGFRRIEVLTGPSRRRRWSDVEKAQAVAETLVPGASVSAVARRRQLSPQQVFTWRRDARAGLLVLPGEAAGLVSHGFVPLVPDMAVAAASAGAVRGPAARPKAAGRRVGPACIEIALAGATIRVMDGTDGALLTEVLRAVRMSAR